MGKEQGTTEASHYDADYFDWQKDVGYFGGWANSFKFRNSVSACDVVIDFGCGGGYLLKTLPCARKIGIEINPAAASAKQIGIEHYFSAKDVREQLGTVLLT